MQAGHQADHDDSGESGHHSPLLVMGGAATAGTAANSKAAVSPVFLIHDPSRVLIYGYTPSPQRGDQVPILCVQEREIESLGFPPPSIGQVSSEEHTSELQSLMRISHAVFCLKKK